MNCVIMSISFRSEKGGMTAFMCLQRILFIPSENIRECVKTNKRFDSFLSSFNILMILGPHLFSC